VVQRPEQGRCTTLDLRQRKSYPASIMGSQEP